MISRRSFIGNSTKALGAILIPSISSCGKGKLINGSIQTPNFSLGHKLREIKDIKPTEFIKHDVVIVGGGVSGLSAARWLQKNNVSFKLLELEANAGGNSRAGQNAISAYPLGAHYLPLPNPNDRNLIEFLEEAGVVAGYHNGLPVYQEYHLCFDPKERLFINHHWQEGLIPNQGIPIKDREEIQRFLSLMQKYREARGADGRYAFELPIDESSQDPEFVKLDNLTMSDFIKQEGYTSSYLYWYINYCCLDDYGSRADDTSAWAGIHYFASRKGRAFNAAFDDVLTWPEGNYFLVKALEKNVKPFVQNKALVLKVSQSGKKCVVDYWDDERGNVVRMESSSVILATPQFVNAHILEKARDFRISEFQYAPWMVANISMNGVLDEKRGEPLSWDNVVYGSNSLGYVNATHQSLSMPSGSNVITYYRPLAGGSPSSERKLIQEVTWESWTQSIFEDLSIAHPELRNNVSAVDVYLWGHGMIKPKVGFIWGRDRAQCKQSIDNLIYFAHSDVGGISVFEEAFAQGIAAAQSVIKNV